MAMFKSARLDLWAQSGTGHDSQPDSCGNRPRLTMLSTSSSRAQHRHSRQGECGADFELVGAEGQQVQRRPACRRTQCRRRLRELRRFGLISGLHGPFLKVSFPPA